MTCVSVGVTVEVAYGKLLLAMCECRWNSEGGVRKYDWNNICQCRWSCGGCVEKYDWNGRVSVSVDQ